MLQQGDLIVLFLLVGAIVAIAVRPLRMRAKSAVPWSESDGGFSGEVPGLLAAHGYEVVAGKQRVPVSVRIGRGFTTAAFTSTTSPDGNRRSIW